MLAEEQSGSPGVRAVKLEGSWEKLAQNAHVILPLCRQFVLRVQSQSPHPVPPKNAGQGVGHPLTLFLHRPVD